MAGKNSCYSWVLVTKHRWDDAQMMHEYRVWVEGLKYLALPEMWKSYKKKWIPRNRWQNAHKIIRCYCLHTNDLRLTAVRIDSLKTLTWNLKVKLFQVLSFEKEKSWNETNVTWLRFILMDVTHGSYPELRNTFIYNWMQIIGFSVRIECS